MPKETDVIRTVNNLAALALAALVLAGCGSSPSTDTDLPVEPGAAAVAIDAGTASPPPVDVAEVDAPEMPTETDADEAAVDEGAADVAAMVAKIDLNAATDAELATIPGVGDRMIREFLEYRPYDSIAQFRREIGKYVDEATVAGYEAYVFVPIDANAADEATLMQLPGVDEAVAAKLIDGRPYADRNAFLASYEAHATDPDVTVAAMYVAAP